MVIILIRKGKITIKQAIISIAIVAIVSLPIILYVVINTLGWDQINLPFLTIPKLDVNRYAKLTSIFSGEFFTTSIKNFTDSIGILISQNDYLPWNSIQPFGTIYLFSTVFTVIGIVNAFKKNKWIEVKYNYIFNIWLIVSIILTFICEPNINRLNIIMIPIIYYTIIGIYIVINNRKKVAIGVGILYLISFGLFVPKYFSENCDEYGTFEGKLEEVIHYVDKIEGKKIHITDKIQSNYIHVLFYTKYDTTKFVETVDYEDPKVEFKKVNSFGKYYFDDIKELNTKENNVYVIKKEEKEKFDLENVKITEFEKYLVIE